MTSLPDPVGYEQAVRSWAQHLRSGGTIPWLEWRGRPAGAVGASAGALPGAAQLELVRRLAQQLDRQPDRRSGGPGAGFAHLADLALQRSGPGRGLGQQPLVWDGPPQPFGPPPVDPAEVPVEELVRVGVGVLTELLLLPAATLRLPRERSRRPWTPAFVLAGAPVTVSVVRRALAASGHREGGRSPRVVLLGEPLDVALTQVWSARVQAGAPVRWRGFVERCARGGDLPEPVDLAARARDWAARVDPAAVHVVLPSPGAPVARTVADVLGVRLADRPADLAPPGAPPWAALTPEAVDVVRRVNAVLGVRVGEDRSAPARRRLVAGLAGRPGAGPLAVPPRFRRWARQRAATLVEQLTAGNYAVHGSLQALAPRPGRGPAHPEAGATLQVVLEACLRHAEPAKEH